ncbi:MAG: hypothetical protein VR64_17190 [Desulfatitalea sp. BRH_c12]|nr:MAG: hypothetical protein VR64_17190 [Desulfatitalea sp. BRH_c12]
MRTTFQIEGEYIALNKLLKAAGLCTTGGMAKNVIEQGRVTVDGITELRIRCKLTKGRAVTLDDTTIDIV